MANKRIERPAQIIKVDIKPISTELKTKITNAFQAIVSKIKEKHLS